MKIPKEKILSYVALAGQRYWPKKPPFDVCESGQIDVARLGLAWCWIKLPPEHSFLGVEGRLFVDSATISPGDGPEWQRCDWPVACFSYLCCQGERHHEQKHGPIHSYAGRLKNVPQACFDYAWVNRIFMLLRIFAANDNPIEEFGPLPDAEIQLTYDVDALDKTWAIRLKQAIFEAVNCIRDTNRMGSLRRLWRIASLTPNYFYLQESLDQAIESKLAPIYFLHARKPSRPLFLHLMDPAYHLSDSRLLSFFREGERRNTIFGLHPSFADWNDPQVLLEGRETLKGVLGTSPTHVRQHWLRFSFGSTWQAQQKAGFELDMTLGFNDRSGFRSGAALMFHPWSTDWMAPFKLKTLPLVFMDSHIYSYRTYNACARRKAIDFIVDEVKKVRGQASVLWHPHTFAKDYNWSEGHSHLIKRIAEANFNR